MDRERWQRIQTIFHQAADLPVSDQAAFLHTACEGDLDLESEVQAMLHEDAGGSHLLDRKLADVAYETFKATDLGASGIKEFGPYRVVRVLGEGGMGIVYLAERQDLKSQVAVKVLRDAWLSPSRRERFASEQRTLAQLNHPSIARLYDADILMDGTPWFVMEYVEGLPLTEYCRQHKSSIEERLRLFRSVCDAVQFAHSHAVIHRDLKPSNILVKSDGSVRLLDFGIAKQMESLDVPVDQTMTGLRFMTPAYAAPEQVRGDRAGTHTDVYSLGVILYELLTGQLPFDLSNLTPAEAATIITDHEPGRPSAIAKIQSVSASPDTSHLSKTAWADLDVLCLTAMNKDPQRRYRSVEALIRDVDHYLEAEPLEARPETASYRVGKFVRRNRRAVFATSAVAVVILGLVAFFTIRLAIARNAALEEAARTERIQHFMMNLFQGGDEAAGPSDSMRVVTLLDRGVQEAKVLNTEPEVQAELYQTLGGIYQKLGKFDKAESLMNSALDERRKLFGPDSRQVADSLVAMGLLRSDQAKMDDSEQLVRQGLDMSRRHLPPNHPEVAKATFALGKVLENRGKYTPAISLLQEAVRLQSTSGDPTTDLADSLSELANCEFYVGHYDISDSLNRRILAMNRQLYGERHPLVADTLINLASIQFQWGHYDQSETFDRQALDIVQSWYGIDHPETADTMTILAQTLTYENRLDESEALLKKSLAIQEKVYGPVHPRVAYALNELGNVASRQGKLDDSEADFTRALNIYRSVYGEKHYLVGLMLSNLGGVSSKRKNFVQAESLFRDALQHYAGTLSPGHINVGITRIRLGNALLGQRRYSDAEQESLAGYDIVAKQTKAPTYYLKIAREDLATEYDALKEPEKAAKFRAELAIPVDQNTTLAARN
jgi:eukaryotic-like serine/threonine-protein kinase